MSFNLAELFQRVVDAVPDREALVVGRDGAVVERQTYAELDARVNRWTAFLAGAGIGPGDHVGLHLRNGAAYVEAMLAAFALRAIPVNLNYRYVADELGPVLADAGVRVLLTEPDLVPVAGAATAAAPAVDQIMAVDEALADQLTRLPADRRAVGGRSGDDHYVLFTGGTTGQPKGVVWRHEDLYFAALGGRGVPRRGVPPVVDPDDVGARARSGMPPRRRLPLCPLVHGAAQWVVLQALLSGGTAILAADRHFDAGAALALAAAARTELLMVVGDATARPLADALAASPDRYDLPGLQVLSSSGAGLSPALAARLQVLLPGVTVLDTFGASETGGQGRLAPRPPADGPGSAAGDRLPRLVADADTAVLDDGGRPVGPGGIGRLARRGAIPLGYHNDPEKTAATFPVIDGVRWSIPGDLARVEDDGTFTVLGRGSVCINTGGEKVHPEEVEAVLRGHPDVLDAVVVGVPDERYGSRVAAVVAPRRTEVRAPGEDTLVAALEAHTRARLSGYKVPRTWVLVERCERLVSGKADYRWAAAVAAGAPGPGSWDLSPGEA